MRQFRVLVNGNEYNVAIEEIAEQTDAAPAPPQPQRTAPATPTAQKPSTPPPAAPKQKTNGDGNGNISAAMPGTILDVRVAVGDTVTKGQPLMILEAMKMENEIMAPTDGTVQEILTSKGASVNSGDLLMVLS